MQTIALFCFRTRESFQRFFVIVVIVLDKRTRGPPGCTYTVPPFQRSRERVRTLYLSRFFLLFFFFLLFCQAFFCQAFFAFFYRLAIEAKQMRNMVRMDMAEGANGGRFRAPLWVCYASTYSLTTCFPSTSSARILAALVKLRRPLEVWMIY